MKDEKPIFGSSRWRWIFASADPGPGEASTMNLRRTKIQRQRLEPKIGFSSFILHSAYLAGGCYPHGSFSVKLHYQDRWVCSASTPLFSCRLACKVCVKFRARIAVKGGGVYSVEPEERNHSQRRRPAAGKSS